MGNTENALNRANDRQIAQMAYDAAAWYKTSFLQCRNFFRSMDDESKRFGKDSFDLPWDKDDTIPSIAARLFWITSLHHTLESIHCLNQALLLKCDDRLSLLADKLLREGDFQSKIKNLRHPNEHKIDYMLGNGDKQRKFERTIETELGIMQTNAHWFVAVHGDCFIGEMNCKDIILHMKKYRDEIIQCLEEIATEYWR